jgi:hypothetical protein
MSTLQTHLNAARRKLLFPTRASCDENILTPYCIEVIDELIIKRNNTLEPSFIATATLTTNAGESKYSLDGIAPNYGKVRYLYTRNESNSSNFNRQIVELVGLDMLTEVYGGGDGVGALPYTGQTITSSAAAVYYDVNLGNMIEFAPIPVQSVVYDFIYEPATNRPTSKQSQGFTLEQFDALVAAKTAFKALLHCKWQGLSRSEAREQRAEIRQHLLLEIGSPESRSGLEYLFWQFNLTSYNDTSDTTIGFLQGTIY